MHVRLLSTVLCAAFARSVHAAATMFVHVKETQRGHRDIQSQCTRMASPLSMLSMPRLRPLQLSPDPPEDERSDSTMKDPYATLGLPPTASLAEIKATFRAIAMQTHPDSIQSKEKFAKFKEAKWAYKLLLDPARKAEYDQRRAVSQFFDLAKEVGQIAVPIAKDFALPLLNLTIQSLDRNLIKGIAIPFLTNTAEQTAVVIKAAMEAQEQGRRAGHDAFEIAISAGEAVKSARHRIHVQQQLRSIASQSESVGKSLLQAMDDLDNAHVEERTASTTASTRSESLETIERTAASVQKECEEIDQALLIVRRQEQAKKATLDSEEMGLQRLLLDKSNADTALQKSRFELQAAEKAYENARMRLLRAREGASHTSVECLVVRSKIIAHQELIAQISDEVQQASEALQNTLEKLSRFREKRRRIEDQVLDQQKEFSEAIELQKRKRSYKAFLEKRVLSLRTKVLRLQQTLNELEAQMTVNRKADSAIEPFQVNSTQSSVVENDVGGATVPAPELQRP